MMDARYLLDTNALLWTLSDAPELTVKAREIIADDNDIYVSDVSLWEIAIKINIGKLDLEGTIFDIEEKCVQLGFERITMKPAHFECLRTLPLIHRDPIDRLIIAQGIIEEMILISSDRHFPEYNINVIW